LIHLGPGQELMSEEGQTGTWDAVSSRLEPNLIILSRISAHPVYLLYSKYLKFMSEIIQKIRFSNVNWLTFNLEDLYPIKGIGHTRILRIGCTGFF